jgi:putative flippase GtrA
MAQGFRYIGVGAVVTGLDYATFLAVAWAWAGHYAMANLLGKLVAGGCGFLLHRTVTFAGRHRHELGPQALRYGLLLLGNSALSTALVYIGTSVLRFSPLGVKIVSDVVVILLAFIVSRTSIFAAAREPGHAP